MGKIKAYEYPDNKLTDCIEWASKLLTSALRGDLSYENKVATLLGHNAPKGGAYVAKMNSLERWGLIEKGKRVTELAETIVKPKDELEKKDAVLKAIYHVKLFKEIREKCLEKIPEENFWEILVGITGASRSEATKKEDFILKIYKDAIDYLNSIKVLEKEVIEVKPSTPPVITPPVIALPTFSLEAEALVIKVPLNAEAIDFASKQIDTWLKYAKKQVESKKPMEAKEKEEISEEEG